MVGRADSSCLYECQVKILQEVGLGMFEYRQACVNGVGNAGWMEMGTMYRSALAILSLAVSFMVKEGVQLVCSRSAYKVCHTFRVHVHRQGLCVHLAFSRSTNKCMLQSTTQKSILFDINILQTGSCGHCAVPSQAL